MERVLKDSDFIVSKTDLKGKIVYGNEIFIEMSGYLEKEILGKPHNILRHKDMPKIIFKLLWDRIKNKEEIFAFVKNRTKNDDYYWVIANVTASLDSRDNILGYFSVRRKPSTQAIDVIEDLYKKLLDAEKQGGITKSEELLNSILNEKGMDYDEFITSIS